MAGLNFDGETIELPCGNCGYKIKATLGRLKREKQVVCPQCNQVSRVDTSKFDADVRDLNRSISNLFK